MEFSINLDTTQPKKTGEHVRSNNARSAESDWRERRRDTLPSFFDNVIFIGKLIIAAAFLMGLPAFWMLVGALHGINKSL